MENPPTSQGPASNLLPQLRIQQGIPALGDEYG